MSTSDLNWYVCRWSNDRRTYALAPSDSDGDDVATVQVFYGRLMIAQYNSIPEDRAGLHTYDVAEVQRYLSAALGFAVELPTELVELVGVRGAA